MARKPPARVRAGLRRMPRPDDRSPRRVVPGVSAPAQRMIADFERARAGPGAVALAVEGWSRWVYSRRIHEPDSWVDECSYSPADDHRGLLWVALRALPSRAAAELRAVVRPLDEVYLARRIPEPESGGREWSY